MESVLSQQAARFVDMVDALALERLQTRYTFMDAEEHRQLLHRDPSEGMRIYWNEMLASVHITAVTAILRSRLWLSGVFSATSDKNLLVFSDCVSRFYGVGRGCDNSAHWRSSDACTTPRHHNRISFEQIKGNRHL